MDIPAGVDPGYARQYIVCGDKVAIAVRVELALEHSGIGNVPNTQKHRARRKVPHLLSLRIAQLKSGHLLLCRIINVFNNRIGEECDLSMLPSAVQHDF